jgi:pimeloyl-ACP methyl ester carboxylesterase
MQYTNADLGVLVTAAESERFAAPLLLLHGLWSGAWVWSRMASYLAHRGWESWALDRLDGPEARESAAAGPDLLGRCQGVARAMPAPPVLVAHDAGAVIALRIAAALGSPAVALINPVLPGRAARRLAFGDLRRTLTALRGRSLEPPSGPGAGADLVDCRDEATRAFVRARLVAEPGRVVYDLLKGRLGDDDVRDLPPTLVIGGNRDATLPVATIAGIARGLGGDDAILDGGHWLPVEVSWQSTANCVHRWVVRTLGEPFLLMRELEEEGEEEA